MSLGLKPYPDYKDSGVEWLGDVPDHWGLLRLGSLLRERRETNATGSVTDVLSVMKDVGVIPYAEKGNVGNKKSDDITRYKIVRPDDIVVNCMNVIIGSVGLSRYTGCLSPVYYVLTRRSGADHPHYLGLCFQAKPFQRSLVRIGNGILAHRMRIPMELLKCELLPHPSPDEQAAIVRYLGYMDGQIRRAIRAKKRLIELLEEQKHITIQLAVTGQTDVSTRRPYPAYRDSGIEWLGDVPEHWRVRQIRRCLKNVVSGIWGEEPSDENKDEHVVCVRVADFDIPRLSVSREKLTVRAVPHSAQAARLLQDGDILIEKSGGGDAQPVGRAVFFDLDVPAVTSNFVSRLRVREHVVRPRFLLYVLALLQSRRINVPSIKQTTGIQNLDEYEYFSTAIGLPTIDEQDAILTWIDDSVDELDSTSDRERRAIGLLREYRARLIADVVTGKFDVREAAASLPEEPDELELDDGEDGCVDGAETDGVGDSETALEEIEA